jgi:hypothetical protein
MLKNILPLSIIGFKNSQRQKTVILSVLRRISACPWYAGWYEGDPTRSIETNNLIKHE